MPKLKLGKVAITTGGVYDSSKAYDKLVIVTHDSQSWVSCSEVPAGNIPGENNGYWQLVSARGEKGDQGEQGAKGDKGDPGLDGRQGPKGDSGYSGLINELLVYNGLDSDDATAALAALQGKVLDEKVAQLSQEWQGVKDSIQDAVLKVEVAPHIEVISVSGGAAILQPDKLYDFGEVATLAVGFEPPLEGNAANYNFIFKCPAESPTTITMPDNIKFPIETGSTLQIVAGKIYQISIINGLAISSSWEA